MAYKIIALDQKREEVRWCCVVRPWLRRPEGKPVRALPISCYLEMPRETVRRHMARLVALGLLERAADQTFAPTKVLREVEIERALRLLRQGTAGLL